MRAEVSLPVAAATAALVYGLYSNATPTVADIRVAPANDKDIDASRKMAAWTSAAVVAGVSLIAKDATIFVLGGMAIITMDWWTRHANAVQPATGKATNVAAVGGGDNSPAMSTGYTDDNSDGTSMYLPE